MINYNEVRQEHDLREILEKNLGPSKSGNKTGAWSCPFHASRGAKGTPSFKLVSSTDYQKARCYGCDWYGDLFDFIKQYNNLENDKQVLGFLGYTIETGLSKEEMEAKKQQYKEERLQRETRSKKAKDEQIETALVRVAGMEKVVKNYHSNLIPGSPGLEYWLKQGYSKQTIDRYRLGYTPDCPLDSSSASFVIPGYQSGKLVSIRHRLASPNGQGPYRPQFAGLPAQLFNTDMLKVNDELGFSLLDEGQALLVEGEKKAIYLDQIGFKVAGLPGLNTWRVEWIEFFKHLSEVLICFDPDVDTDNQKKRSRWNIAQDLRGTNLKVKIIRMPFKPDDFFVKHGGSLGDFLGFLKWGKEVK